MYNHMCSSFWLTSELGPHAEEVAHPGYKGIYTLQITLVTFHWKDIGPLLSNYVIPTIFNQ